MKEEREWGGGESGGREGGEREREEMERERQRERERERKREREREMYHLPGGIPPRDSIVIRSNRLFNIAPNEIPVAIMTCQLRKQEKNSLS